MALPKIRLKAEIPEALKAELAPTKWGKMLSVTPVVMTVIATMLAGLSSSEMTLAQYDRSLAAQRQSKAGDQWNFFQAKRLRSVVQQTTVDLMFNTSEVRALEPAALRLAFAGAPAALAALETPAGQQALAALCDGALPKLAAPPVPTAGVRAALEALEASRPEAEIAARLAQVTDVDLAEALQASQAHALALDGLLKPLSQAIDLWEKQLNQGTTDVALRRNFAAARLRYNAHRYDSEARLNQAIAVLFELQVRQSNFLAERHHRRSSRFFYGMLAAQMGVIVSTLAMAAQKRNLLWSIAAVAGLVAVAFTLYVFVYV